MTIECPNCGGCAVDVREWELDPRQHVFECRDCGNVFMKEVE